MVKTQFNRFFFLIFIKEMPIQSDKSWFSKVFFYMQSPNSGVCIPNESQTATFYRNYADLFLPVVVVNLFLHYLAAYGRLVQSDLFGTITQITFTPDTLCACVVTTDLILTEPISALNVLHKWTQHFSLTLNAQILNVSTQHPQIDITYRI